MMGNSECFSQRGRYPFPRTYWMALTAVGVALFTQLPVFYLDEDWDAAWVCRYGDWKVGITRGAEGLYVSHFVAYGSKPLGSIDAGFPFLRQELQIGVGLTQLFVEQSRWLPLQSVRRMAADPRGDTSRREKAILYLGEICDDEWLPSQVYLLSDPDASVRRAAEFALAAVGVDTASEAIIARLNASEPRERLEAVRAVYRYSIAGQAETLFRLIRSDEPEIAAAAARALAAIGNATGLLRELLQHPNPHVVACAAAPLAKSDRRAAEALLQICRDQQDHGAAIIAVEALAARRDGLAERGVRVALAHRNPDVRAEALRAATLWPQAGVDDLLWKIGRDDPCYGAALAARIVRGDTQAHAILLDLAKSSTGFTHIAQYLLGFLQDPWAIANLPAAFGYDVSWIALGILRRNEGFDRRSVEVLTRAEFEGYPYESSFVRTTACQRLGELGDRRSIPVLAQALDDKSWAVRVRAAEALGRILGQPWGPRVRSVRLAREATQRFIAG